MKGEKMKKYELIPIAKDQPFKGVNFKIRALKDFTLRDGNSICKGDFGGFVSSEENLSQEGTCWIGKDSVVLSNARVSGDALVKNTSIVSGSAVIADKAIVSRSVIKENAKILDIATVSGGSTVRDNAIVQDYAFVDAAIVSGSAKILGHAEVEGDSRISDNAIIRNFATVFHSSVSGNAIIERDAGVDSCTIGEDMLISGACQISSSLLRGKYEIGLPESHEPYYFAIIDALSDQEHPIFTFPADAANVTAGFAVFHRKYSKVTVSPVFVSFSYMGHHNKRESIMGDFSDVFIEKFMSSDSSTASAYNISKDKIATKIKSFLLKVDLHAWKAFSAPIFDISNKWAKNFINEVRLLLPVPKGKYETLFKQIKYCVFGSILSPLSLSFVPGNPRVKYAYLPDEKFQELLNLCNIDFSTGEIKSFVDVVPYNEYMLKIVADVLDLEPLSFKDFEKIPNSLYI